MNCMEDDILSKKNSISEIEKVGITRISSNIQDNIEYYNKLFNVKNNFDLLYRTFYIGDKLACIYFIDGFTKDDVLERVMEFFYELKPEDVPDNGHDMSKMKIPYGETDLLKEEKQIVKNLMSGVVIMFVDGYDLAFGIDCRQYPARSVTEPEKNKSMRGSRDGFVETLVFNTALVRRRIRDVDLTMEMLEVGTASKTDIAVCYMGNRVDKQLLTNIKNRIKNIKVDSLTMNQESIAECLYKKVWINPFPKFKYSERPDATAAALLEGNIVILVDNSPSAMILPASVFDIIEEADDYYFPPITGTYLRLSRFIINICALLVTPTWLLMVNNHQFMPTWLEFTLPKDVINIPLILQFLILELAIDGLRLAALNTPSMLSTPLSVIAALVIGDFAVGSGWFNSEAMLYMAFVALANYTQPSFELGYALKFMRIIILVLTSIFGLGGYIGGIIFTVGAIAMNKTLSGKSYIYPLLPFNAKKFLKRFFRFSINSVSNNKQ